MDEPPCKVGVRLREFPYDPLLSRQELEEYLDKITREMQILRQIRHQYIACVIGHFQTGSSLVEVSDWFDGQSLEESWAELEEESLLQKVALMIKISQGLAFCHEKRVFHRNICGESILADDEFGDIRIQRFQFAKNIELSQTLPTTELGKRDPRLFAPEELEQNMVNPRLSDIFQTGVLFYRILENGKWPFESTMDYYTGNREINEWTTLYEETGESQIHSLIKEMLAPDPSHRTNLMPRVERSLNDILAVIG